MPEPVVPPGARTLSVLSTGQAPKPPSRKPSWLKVRATMGPNFNELKGLMREAELNTVCESVSCPGLRGAGRTARRPSSSAVRSARACPFCQIGTGKPKEYDTDEPRRVAHTVARMGLKFAVITGVARDDLEDGGSWLFAESIRQVRELLPGAASRC